MSAFYSYSFQLTGLFYADGVSILGELEVAMTSPPVHQKSYNLCMLHNRPCPGEAAQLGSGLG